MTITDGLLELDADDGTRVPTSVRLDARPLLEAVARRVEVPFDYEADTAGTLGKKALGPLLGVDPRTVSRWRTEGLSVWVADKVTANLGWHPLDVWGDRWLEAITVAGEGETIT